MNSLAFYLLFQGKHFMKWQIGAKNMFYLQMSYIKREQTVTQWINKLRYQSKSVNKLDYESIKEVFLLLK